MDLSPAIRDQWAAQHSLSPESLAWLAEHADLGDVHPIMTALAILRLPDDGVDSRCTMCVYCGRQT